MSSEDLSLQVEALVDNLRASHNRNVAPSLADVASVTEVLIATMRTYFRSVDTSIYRECRELSDYLTNARKEIASLSFPEGNNSKIPRAGLELDAIVRATEEATNTIMTAAEEIMAADTSDAEAYQAITQDGVMRIFEACSFQDITGQRISKVVETLSFIEKRIFGLKDMLNVVEDDLPDGVDADLEYKLEHGPALEGQGVNQAEIDAMLNGQISAELLDSADKSIRHPSAAAARAQALAEPDIVAEPEPQPQPEALNADDIDALFAAAAPEPAPAPEPEPAAQPARIGKAKAGPPPAAPAATTTQDDIDALFG